MSKIKDLNLFEGTLNFWIPEMLFDYRDNISHILVNYSNENGSIFIEKSDDGKIKFSHVLIGRGRTDTDVDVSDLSSSDKHMITATWSLKDKEIRLYIDGNKSRKGTRIEYCSSQDK